ncbi:MAG TPA: hypothetical protein DCY20_08095 [Firmicutes bacterium]|nr:hypothetical protein [Bacillota bacterium]
MSNLSKSEVKHQNIVPLKEMPDDLMEVINLMEFVNELHEGQYESVLKKLPQLRKSIKTMHKSTKRTLKVAKKLSRSQKKYYFKLSKKVTELIKDDNVDPALKHELIIILKDITRFMNEADMRDKEFLESQHKKILSYGGIALLTLGSIYGIKIRKR